MAYFRKRGKKWYYTIEVKGAHGERKKVERPGGLTKAECEKAYRAAMAEVDQTGDYVEPTNLTVAEYFRQWLSEYVETNLKYNTIRTYRMIINIHIIPAIGNLKLRRVSGRILQNFLNEKKETHAKKTLVVIHAILKRAFAYAVSMYQYIKANPADVIRIPAYMETPKEAPVFQPEQIAAIFEKYPPGHPCYMPIVLSYHTGMRKGECLALSWKDVDFSAKVLHVRYTVIGFTKSDARIQEIPKTASSIREITFGQRLYKVLKAQKARQAARRLEYGQHYKQNDFVCTWPDGSMVAPADLACFNLYCKKAFGAGSFHTLRHTHATLLLEAGEDIELVAKRLGHNTIITTSKTYSHILEKRKARTVALLDQVFGP